MADVFGAIAASLTLCQQCCQTAIAVRGVLNESSTLEDELSDMKLKHSAECRRLVALKTLLFDASAVGGKALFEKCSDRRQQDILRMLERLQTCLLEMKTIWAKYHVEHVTQSSTTQISAKAKLRWSLWDKARATTLLSDLGDWNDRIKQDVLASFLPLSIFSSPDQLAALMSRRDIQNFGIAGDIALRRLLLEDVQPKTARFDRSALRPKHNSDSYQLAQVGRGVLVGAYVLLNYKQPISTQEGHGDTTQHRVNQLGNLLNQARTAIELPVLEYHGILEDSTSTTENTDQMRYAFVFKVPLNVQPRPITLKEALLGQSQISIERPPLEERFRLASALAASLLKIHLLGWLHKGLRSENVLFFQEKGNNNSDLGDERFAASIGNPYLWGFDYTRPTDVLSSIPQLANLQIGGDHLPEHVFYQHRERYSHPPAAFSFKHDIYALGIILLEIGLWQSARSMASSVLRPSNTRGLVPEDLGKEIHKRLVQRTHQKLRFCMGTQYQRVVLKCLEEIAWSQCDNQADEILLYREEIVEVLAKLDRVEA